MAFAIDLSDINIYSTYSIYLSVVNYLDVVFLNRHCSIYLLAIAHEPPSQSVLSK